MLVYYIVDLAYQLHFYFAFCKLQSSVSGAAVLHCKCQGDYFCQQNWSRRLQPGHVIPPPLLAPPPPPLPKVAHSSPKVAHFSLSSPSLHLLLFHHPPGMTTNRHVPTALLLATNTGKSPHVPRWWNPLDLEQAVGSIWFMQARSVVVFFQWQPTYQVVQGGIFTSIKSI